MFILVFFLFFKLLFCSGGFLELYLVLGLRAWGDF